MQDKFGFVVLLVRLRAKVNFATESIHKPLSDLDGRLTDRRQWRIHDSNEVADPAISELEGRESQNLFARLSFQPAEDHSIYLDIAGSEEDRNYFTRSRSGVDYESMYDLDKQQFGAGYRGVLAMWTCHSEVTSRNSNLSTERPKASAYSLRKR